MLPAQTVLLLFSVIIPKLYELRNSASNDNKPTHHPIAIEIPKLFCVDTLVVL